MNPAAGLVDFSTELKAGGERLFGVVDEAGAFVHVPGRLELATEDGLPDLSLGVVRGASPGQPPEPHGTIDLRVRPAPVSGEVLAHARRHAAGARVSSVVFDGGYLRLQATAGTDPTDEALLDELERPLPVASNGLDSARASGRLHPDAALLLREVLTAGGMTVTAVAEMSLRGLAPRLPAKVAFRAAALRAALGARSDAQARITDAGLQALWEDGAVAFDDADGLDDVQPATLAQALADWTVAHFGTAVASPGRDVTATWRLDLDETGDEVLTWDLWHGRTTRRIAVLTLDPFAAARRAVDARGLDAVWHETVVPPLEAGAVEVEVRTNLPEDASGILRWGAELRAPANPPARVHELSQALVFDDPQSAERFSWQLAPGEELRYEHQTLAVLRVGDGVQQHRGPRVPSNDRSLLIGAGDMPVRLIAVGAGGGLLRHATVHAILRRAGEEEKEDDSGSPGTAFELSRDKPRATIALPPEDEGDELRLEIEACDLDDADRCAALEPLPARSVQLDLPSFPAYGPQTVEVRVDFDVQRPLVALELVPETREDAEAATVLSFTPDAPRRSWRYSSTDPFTGGYRYRVHGQRSWSETLPAGADLLLRASELDMPAGGPTPDHPEGFRFETLYCYPTGEPSTFRVVPLEPSVRLDDTGAPVGMAVAAGDGGIVQLEVRLGPDGDQVERLRAELRRRLELDDDDAIVLEPGPLRVERVTLQTVDADGGRTGIAQASASATVPYTALFNVQLDADAWAAASAALAGEEGRLEVRYDVFLDTTPGADGRAMLTTDVGSRPRDPT
jgi:hypothetical protein